MAVEILLTKKRIYILVTVLFFLFYFLIGNIVRLNDQVVTLKAWFISSSDENEKLRILIEELESVSERNREIIEDYQSQFEELELNSSDRNYYYSY